MLDGSAITVLAECRELRAAQWLTAGRRDREPSRIQWR